MPPPDSRDRGRQFAQRLRQLFDAVHGLPRADQAARVRELAAGNQELEHAALDLLDADGADTGVLVAGVQGALSAAAEPPLPARIGPYQVLSRLGIGGMGVVYLARHPDLGNRVAVKVSQHLQGLSSAEVLERFALERRALAAMSHRCIARIYDAGTTADGQPFFVLEYVDGAPITRYCDERRLSVAARLRLFLQLCEGVQHAHGRFFVHRDLKPDNVLVVDEAGAPLVKILDFGLAKVTATDSGEKPPGLTGADRRLGTLLYMSPEQVEGRNDDVDVRSDVYALGVMLYELLAGELPFPAAALEHLQRAEGRLSMLRHLSQRDPEPPSRRVASRAASAPLRGVSQSALRRALTGDLDHIVLKAMAKEPERRYAAPAALADDLGRYLDHLPVLAGPPSAVYRLRKFARRYRGVLVSVAAVLATALLGAVAAIREAMAATASAAVAQDNERRAEASARLAQRAAEEAELAQQEAEANARTADERAREVRLVAEFQARAYAELSMEEFGHGLLQSLRSELAESLPRQESDSRTVAQALADFDAMLARVNATNVARDAFESAMFQPALQALERDFGDRPALRGVLRASLAATMRELGMLQLAGSTVRAALPDLLQQFGIQHGHVLSAKNTLASVLQDQGQRTEAEQLFRQVHDGLQDSPDAEPNARVVSGTNLGILLRQAGKYEEAATQLQAASQEADRLLGSDNPEAINTATALAGLLRQLGRLDEAEALLRSKLELSSARFGRRAARTQYILFHLARLSRSRGRFAETKQLYEEILPDYRARLGDHHAKTLTILHNLVDAMVQLGEYAEAAAMSRRIADTTRQVFGDHHPDSITAMAQVAGILRLQMRPEESLQAYQEIMRLAAEQLEAGQEEALLVQQNFGTVLEELGRHEEAEQAVRKALAVWRSRYGNDYPRTLACEVALGLLLVEQRGAAQVEGLQLLRRASAHPACPAPFAQKARRRLGDH